MITMHPSSLWKSEETKAEVGLIPITLRAFQCSGDSIKRCNYLFHKAPHLLFVFPLHPYLHQLLPPAIAGGFMCVYTSVISAQRGHNKQNTSPWVHFSEWALLRIVAPVVHKEGGEQREHQHWSILSVQCWIIVCHLLKDFSCVHMNPSILYDSFLKQKPRPWPLSFLKLSYMKMSQNEASWIFLFPCACLFQIRFI